MEPKKPTASPNLQPQLGGESCVKPVVGRLAPSPSGRMHLGNVLSAMLAWLAVRSACGKLILRIEDLDPRASKPELASQLIDDLAWLGIDWDEGPVYQHQRLSYYENALEKLQIQGLVYPCFCTREELHVASAPHASDGSYIYRGTCRKLSPAEIEEKSATRAPAQRLRVPSMHDKATTIVYDDLVCGHYQEALATDCGDFLIQRSDGVFAYQLAVVVDDAEMGVTQVVRGNDLLSSAARQQYLQSLLGYAHPSYAHVPLLVAADGRRLSKRNHDMDLGYLRTQGVNPECIVSALATLLDFIDTGELCSLNELVSVFSWEKLRSCKRELVIDNDFVVGLLA